MNKICSQITEETRIQVIRNIIPYEGVRMVFDELCKIVESSEKEGTKIISHVEIKKEFVPATVVLSATSLSNATLYKIGKAEIKAHFGIPAIRFNLVKGFLTFQIDSMAKNQDGKDIDIHGGVIPS
jgi:hypothetical protein